MKRLAWGIGFIVIILVLSGCRGQANLTDEPPAPISSPSIAALTEGPLVPSAPGDSPTPSPVITPTITLQPPTDMPAPSPSPVPEGGLRLLYTIRYTAWDLVHDLAWSPDGRWLAAAAGERVYLYDGASLAPQGEISVGTWASELAFAPGPIAGRAVLALAGRDGTLQFWDLDEGAQWLMIHAHNKGANSLSFSPDGRWLASAGNDAILRLWETVALSVEGEISPAAEMIGGAAAVPAVRFSPQTQDQPDGLVVSVDLQAIRMRDPGTSRLVRTLSGDASIFALAFSPDGSVLAAAEENASLRLWDPSSGDAVAVLQPPEADPEAFLWDAAFHPAGSLLGTVDSAGQVLVWSYPKGDLLADFQGHIRAAAAVAFSPDGMRLATGGLDGMVRVWSLP